jgi:amino acid transporter
METGKHGLKRELKLWDLVPMQIILIVWLGWTGFAAKQGPSQIVLWFMAIFLFYLPLAAVVMKLSRAMPVEGGAYQWVRAGISPFAGYMTGWCLTIYAITSFASIGPTLANGIAYTSGPGGAWMAASKTFTLTLALLSCLIAYVLNVRGMHLIKWLSSSGTVLTIATFVVMVSLLVKAFATAPARAHAAFSLAWPGFTFATLNVFTKMALGGLSGFDSSAVFAEECRKPENDVARSVMISAPLIAFMYILGTSTVLAYIAPPNVDLAAPVGQVMQAGFGATGLGRALAAISVEAFNVGFLASFVIVMGMVSRLPMVAGWDGLLPAWWSELHPRYRTPSKAIAAVCGCGLLFSIFSLVGAGNQEATQIAVAAGIGSICIQYMLLFGTILFGFRSGVRSGLWIRLAALSAFLVSLVSLIFELVPAGDVADTKTFALKVAVVIIAANSFGAFLYWRGAERLRAAAVAVEAAME